MYRICERGLLVWAIFQLSQCPLCAQMNDSIPLSKLPNILSVSTGIYHGFIFAHSAAVENTKGAHPTGLEINIGWQRSDPLVWNICNCFPRKGLLLSYY